MIDFIKTVIYTFLIWLLYIPLSIKESKNSNKSFMHIFLSHIDEHINYYIPYELMVIIGLNIFTNIEPLTITIIAKVSAPVISSYVNFGKKNALTKGKSTSVADTEKRVLARKIVSNSDNRSRKSVINTIINYLFKITTTEVFYVVEYYTKLFFTSVLLASLFIILKSNIYMFFATLAWILLLAILLYNICFE